MKKIIISVLGIIVTISAASAFTRGTAEYKAFEKVFYEECVADGDMNSKECKCTSKCVADQLNEYTTEQKAYEIGFRCGMKCAE